MTTRRRRANASDRARAVIFGAVLGAALGLTQIAGAASGGSGSSSSDVDACAHASGTPLCRSDAGSAPEQTSAPSSGSEPSLDAGGATGSDGPATSQEEPAPADLQVTKTSDAAGIYREGDPIVYTITVTNAGGTAAEDVELHDSLPRGMGGVGPGSTLKGDPCLATSSMIVGQPPQAAVTCGPVTLEAGESATVEIEADTVGLCGRIVNTVAVEASNEPAELAASGNTAQAADRGPECNPDIAIDVSASPTEGAVGDTVAFTYTVTNTGDSILYGIGVRDEAVGSLGLIDGFSLEPGRSDSFSRTVTLGASSFTNVATAEGADVTGRQVRAQDAVTVTIVSAGGVDEGTGGTGTTPFTGAETWKFAVWALSLTALGSALVRLTTRRRSFD